MVSKYNIMLDAKDKTSISVYSRLATDTVRDIRIWPTGCGENSLWDGTFFFLLPKNAFWGCIKVFEKFHNKDFLYRLKSISVTDCFFRWWIFPPTITCSGFREKIAKSSNGKNNNYIKSTEIMREHTTAVIAWNFVK